MTIRSGPVELVVLVPPENQAGAEDENKPAGPSPGHGRIAALAAQLGRDPRSYRELSPEERRARLRRLRGIGRGLTSGSEEFARRKLEEVELEERKFAR